MPEPYRGFDTETIKAIVYVKDVQRALNYEDERDALDALYAVFQALERVDEVRSAHQFLVRVSRNLEKKVGPERVVRAVFRVMADRIARGEVEDFRDTLPAELLPLWPAGGDAGGGG